MPVLASRDLFSSFQALSELFESCLETTLLVLNILGVATPAAGFSPDDLEDPVWFNGIVEDSITAAPTAVDINPEVNPSV